MEFCALTDTGKLRDHNEDFLFATDMPVGPLPNLFMVADGMGGHKAGEVASELAVKNVLSFIRGTDSGNLIKEVFSGACSFANGIILSNSLENSDMEGMGTTLVLCSVSDDTISVANIGDSRLYCLGKGGFEQVTRDHTVVAEMLRMGSISKVAAARHPKRHMLTRVLGVGERIEVDFFKLKREDAQQILMCTDGVCDMLSDEELKDILSDESSVSQRAEEIITQANLKGGDDNSTIILIDFTR